MMAANYCPSCGASIGLTERFCRSCAPRTRDFASSMDLAPMWMRIAATLLNVIILVILVGLIILLFGASSALGGLAVIISVPGYIIWYLRLMTRGQDPGARIMGVRVMRDTGDVAGFFQMWTRLLATSISGSLFWAGYLWAFFDEDRQTWHDKIVGTYVVRDGPGVRRLRGSSSTAAVAMFWLSLLALPVLIVIEILIAIIAFPSGPYAY